jgi:Tfp pilus assembly protein PilN
MSEHAIIAFVLRDKRVEWTALQRRKHRMEIVQQKSVELEWPESVTDHRSAEAAAFLKTKVPPLKGRVGIVVPSDRVLMRIIELPSINREELLGMAELQVDKFSPFPSDQMSLAIEVLHEGADSSRVLIAAVQHEYIDHVGDFLMKAGLYPQSVDVDVLSWWTLIRDGGKVRSEGQEILVIYDDHCAQMIVVRDGIPVMIRALDTHLDAHEAAFAVEIAEELEYTLMTLEGTWGSQPTNLLTLWVRGHAAEEVLQELRKSCALDVASANLLDLPPLSEGLSRRLSAPESASLDLAPPGWRKGIQSKQFQRQAALIAAAAFGGWLLLMLILFLFTNQQKSKLARAQKDMTRLQNEMQEVTDLKGQVKSLEQYADRTYSSLECLREITERLPAGVDITSITYNKSSQINLRGEADSDSPIYEFIKQLEGSALFREVKTEGINTQVRGGRNRSLFRLTMTLPNSDPEGEGES